MHQRVNQGGLSAVNRGMSNFFSMFQNAPIRPDKDDDNRLLKKLRIALLFWFISFVITIIWFSFSPAS